VLVIANGYLTTVVVVVGADVVVVVVGILTPAFQTRFDLTRTHVYFFPPKFVVNPNLAQALPCFTTAELVWIKTKEEKTTIKERKTYVFFLSSFTC